VEASVEKVQIKNLALDKRQKFFSQQLTDEKHLEKV